MSEQDKAKDAVAVTTAKLCINIFRNSKSYLTLYNADGPFVPGVTITKDVTSGDDGVWKPKRCKGNDPKYLHLRLTCKTSPTLVKDPNTGRPFVPATGDLTIVVSGAPSPALIPVVYVDDDPTLP
jgi:hypothetical protein